ncbi:MAG: DUF4253 domain-containing protein [Myxococcota bacterium]
MKSFGDAVAAYRNLTPFRAVFGEGSDSRFPVPAFCTKDAVAPIDAWSAWLHLREDPAFAKKTCIVVLDAAPVLSGPWAETVTRAEGVLREWAESKEFGDEKRTETIDAFFERFDVRHVLRRFGVTAEGPEVDLDDLGEELFDLLDASDSPVEPFPPVGGRPTHQAASEVMVLQWYVPRSAQPLADIAWPFVSSRNEGAARVVVMDAPSWQAPALLGFRPFETKWATNALLLRRWSLRYGVDLVALGRSRMEAYAAKPPRSHAQARRAVGEIALMCPSMLEEGAAPILGEALGHCWRLSWDIE